MSPLPSAVEVESDPALAGERAWSRRRILAMGGMTAATGFLTGLPSAAAGWPEEAWPVRDLGSARAEPGVAAAQPAAPMAPEIEPAPEAPAEPGPEEISAALIDEPPFVGRGAWCESEPAGNHRRMGAIERVTIHHTGADTRALGATDLQTVQRIEGYHRDELGWSCIGYHFLVAWDGTLYEGRPLGLQGAHVRWNNPGNIGVAVIGDCEHAEPSPAQRATLAWVVERCCSEYALHPGAVVGHRELVSTTCPGQHLFAWLTEWRARRLAGDGSQRI